MIWGMVFRIAIPLIIAGAVIYGLIWGIPKLVTLLLQGLGFGVFIILIWLLVIIWVIATRRAYLFAEHWYRWLGAILLTLALFGILGVFHPDTVMGTVSASAGGRLGSGLAGSSLSWLRIMLLAIGGIVCLTPRGTTSFLEWLRFSAFPSLGSGGANLKEWLTMSAFPAIGRSWESIRDWFSGRRRRPPTRWEQTTPTPIDWGEKPPEDILTTEETPTPIALEPIEPVAIIKEVPPEAVKVQRKEPAPIPEVVPAVEDKLPPLDLLSEVTEMQWSQSDNEARAKLIEEALASYGVEAKVMQIKPGPSVTQFGVEPGWDRKYRRVTERDPDGRVRLERDGSPKVRLEETSKTRVKVERIASLANDLALALAVPTVRVEAPVMGTGLVGIEVPNIGSALVSLREVIETPAFQRVKTKSKLAVALGKGAGGEPVVADLAKMPHLLIAGATGTGKTVCLNSFIVCLLMHAAPSEVRLVVVDPKRVEMISYNAIPHLMNPVVVEVDKVVDVLRRLTMEMENRFRKFAAVGARNIEGYNQKAAEPIPYIVVVIDELADLMMAAPEIIEQLICRLAQLSRATGIHLVVATQRPSVDVVTGLIKANFPARVSFAVASAIDSRTILDSVGAERLLGGGDALFLPADAPKPTRLRGCYVSDPEIEKIVNFWRRWARTHSARQEDRIAQDFSTLDVEKSAEDPIFSQAKELIREHKHVSVSLLQRRLRIGYPRAAKLMDLLQEEGLVSDSGEVIGKNSQEEP